MNFIPSRIKSTIAGLNQNQKNILIVAVALGVLMLLFPPYLIFANPYLRQKEITGYGFLFDLEYDAVVREGRLFTQWLAVGVLALAACFVARAESKVV